MINSKTLNIWSVLKATVHTWSLNKTSVKWWVCFSIVTKNVAMTNFSWWNEDGMETSNGADYWRNPKLVSNCTLQQESMLGRLRLQCILPKFYPLSTTSISHLKQSGIHSKQLKWLQYPSRRSLSWLERARLEFAERHLEWTVDDWKRVWWSDKRDRIWVDKKNR